MTATYTWDVFCSLDGYEDAADVDLELLENRTLDRHVQEPVYRPTLH